MQEIVEGGALQPVEHYVGRTDRLVARGGIEFQAAPVRSTPGVESG